MFHFLVHIGSAETDIKLQTLEVLLQLNQKIRANIKSGERKIPKILSHNNSTILSTKQQRGYASNMISPGVVWELLHFSPIITILIKSVRMK